MIRPGRISARSALAGLVAASLLGAGVALAIDHSGAPSISAVRAGSAAAASPSPSSPPGKHGLRPNIRGFGGAGDLGFAPGKLVGILAHDTGLTMMQIVQDIQKGQTLDQIAGSHDAQVKSDELAAVKTSLDAAMSKKVITSTQETSLLNDAKDIIDQVMAANLGNAGFKGLPFGGRHPNAPKPAPPGSSSSSSSSSNATS